MARSEAERDRPRPTDAMPVGRGLLDVLGVAAAVLDERGRIVLWSPQAGELFGYSDREALGRPAAQLLVEEDRRPQVLELFARVMSGHGPWAGVFPVRHRDGHIVRVEFRNMRLVAEGGRPFALGIASEETTLRRVERDVALSSRLVDQSPIGLAVLDTELRYVLVNAALERINGVAAQDHLGRTTGEVLPHLDAAGIEARMRTVLESGEPLLDEVTTGCTPADPHHEHAWSASFYRLEDQAGQAIGVAISVVDITDQHRAALSVARARRRLSLIADASIRIGTSLDLAATARELADVAVPEVADIAAVDLLDAVLAGSPPGDGTSDVRFRALAVKSARPGPALAAADPVGEVARYGAQRLVAQCARTGRPVLVPRVRGTDLARIARDPAGAELLRQAGVHSYLAVPLIARGEVLGALDLKRARTPVAFDADDLVLATELAARAAVCIDNARWYQQQRHAALALQRHLLPPRHTTDPPGLAIAHRYQPATTADETGGDWFDAIPLPDECTALVVGDVMGSGITAAATMGQLRTSTRTLARLGLAPDEVLTHLDETTQDLGEVTATCVLAHYDPRSRLCRLACAGHLPPVLVRAHRPPRLLALDPGAPLGVGSVPFRTTDLHLRPGDDLVLYTDGLVEVRDQDIDQRLEALTDLLAGPHRPLEDTCDLLLSALRRADTPDDVALLIARALP